MAETFNWTPDDRPTGRFASRVSEVRFGDGYRQRGRDGINTKSQSWPLSFDRDEAEIDDIKDFLDRNEALWFWWTPPRAASPRKFTCDDYSVMPYAGGSAKLTCTFEEFNAP